MFVCVSPSQSIIRPAHLARTLIHAYAPLTIIRVIVSAPHRAQSAFNPCARARVVTISRRVEPNSGLDCGRWPCTDNAQSGLVFCGCCSPSSGHPRTRTLGSFNAPHHLRTLRTGANESNYARTHAPAAPAAPAAQPQKPLRRAVPILNTYTMKLHALPRAQVGKFNYTARACKRRHPTTTTPKPDAEMLRCEAAIACALVQRPKNGRPSKNPAAAAGANVLAF